MVFENPGRGSLAHLVLPRTCLAKAACPLAHNRDAFPDGSASWRMRLNDPQWDWNAGEWGGVGGRRGEGLG